MFIRVAKIQLISKLPKVFNFIILLNLTRFVNNLKKTLNIYLKKFYVKLYTTKKGGYATLDFKIRVGL